MIKITIEVDLHPIVQIAKRVAKVGLIMACLYSISQIIDPGIFPFIQTACAISAAIQWSLPVGSSSTL